MSDDRDELVDPFERFERRGARAVRTALIRLPAPRSKGRPPENETAASGPAAAPAAQSWIGVQLIDSAGNPRAGEPFKITLSDGRQLEGKLDTRGIARFDEIPRGECRVSFPQLGRAAAGA